MQKVCRRYAVAAFSKHDYDIYIYEFEHTKGEVE